MRAIVLAAILLATGCSAAGSLNSPGKTPRQEILDRARGVGQSQNYAADQTACIVGALDKQLSDADMKSADAAIAAGTPTPTLDKAIETAIFGCATP